MLVSEKVKGGVYGSASEVIGEALCLLVGRGRTREQDIGTVRAKIRRWIEQLDRGEGILESVAVDRLRAMRKVCR
jgi:antitoxin ParD1/3/4